MKKLLILIIPVISMAAACTSQKKLAYLNISPQSGINEPFTMEIPDYLIQPRDILYISIKALNPEGRIIDFLSSNGDYTTSATMQGESGQYLFGYDVNADGKIILPVIGQVPIAGLTLSSIRELLQIKADSIFKNATVDCKLLSFKYTVIGEVKMPGTYINYNSYLTVFEAIGRAGGIGDFGRRDNVTVIRPTGNGTETFTLNLQDKKILSSNGYFLLPNDVIIIEPQKNKIFNMNLPSISFILTSITSTISMLILIMSFTNGN